jgi:energy-coupling factor transport system permease protein
VPKFKAQFQVVSEAQRCVGRDISDGTVLQRLRNAVTILSIMVTWALENAIETADSMKSRGYGLPGRSAFSIYRMDDRDKGLLAWLGFCGVFIFSGAMAGGLYWRYFPSIKGAELLPLTVAFQAVYLALCLTPVLLDVYENYRWRKLEEGGIS